MNRRFIEELSREFVENSFTNIVGPHTPYADGYYGLKIFGAPLVGIGRADDPYWKKLLEPQAVGQHMLLPEQWLENAKSVICFFLPANKVSKEANAVESRRNTVVPEWLFARTDANWVAMSLAFYICEKLEEQDFKTVVPQNDPRFGIRGDIRQKINELGVGVHKLEGKEDQRIAFPTMSSNWSERHSAYVCGLGTFGMSTNIITKIGTAGRFITIITDWVADSYDLRNYFGLTDYCIFCGKCAERCPAGAIDKKYPNCKNQQVCFDYCRVNEYRYVPRYGCGKCQVGIPCRDGIPNAESN